MKLSVGFIGLGAMGSSHVNSIHRLCGDRATVAGICGKNEANLKRARDIAPSATVFRDEAELLRSSVDAVFVSTPNFTHLPLALEALRAGKHLFLEKPCGISRSLRAL